MKATLLLLLLAILFLSARTQDYGMGATRDDAAYRSLPEKATMLNRDYEILPSSYSLKKYCPEPGHQGGHGTCTGWAVAWAARTIIYAKQNKITNTSTISHNTFAPLFVYTLIREKFTDECKKGSYPGKALELLKNKGVPKFSDFDYKCTKTVPSNLYPKAEKHKIRDYVRLFGYKSTDTEKTLKMKKAVAEGNPVVIAISCPPSFNRPKGVWKPDENPDDNFGGHALCIVGYDDNKYGGAFEIMNSWGTHWGNDGFITKH